jgi:hypothetical protein
MLHWVEIAVISAALGWWWSDNEIFKIFRTKLNVEWSGCDKCAAFIIHIILCLILKTEYYYILSAPLSSIFAIYVSRETNKF